MQQQEKRSWREYWNYKHVCKHVPALLQQCCFIIRFKEVLENRNIEKEIKGGTRNTTKKILIFFNIFMEMTLGYLLRGSALSLSTMPCHWKQPMVHAYVVCILLFVVATKVGIRNPVNVTWCSMFLKLLMVFTEPCPCILFAFSWNGKIGGGKNQTSSPSIQTVL